MLRIHFAFALFCLLAGGLRAGSPISAKAVMNGDAQDKRIAVYMRVVHGLPKDAEFVHQKAFRDIRLGMRESVVLGILEKEMGERITEYNSRIGKSYWLPDGVTLEVTKFPKLRVKFTFARFYSKIERILESVEISPSGSCGDKDYGWKINEVVAKYKSEIPNSKSVKEKFVEEEVWGGDELSQMWKFLAFMMQAKVNRIKTGDPNGKGSQRKLSESDRQLLEKCEKEMNEFKGLGVQQVYGNRYTITGDYATVSMKELRHYGTLNGRTGMITVSDEKLHAELLKISKIMEDAEREERMKKEKEKQQKVKREEMNF